MPLVLLLVLVIGGILGIALLVHRLGLTPPVRLTTKDQAMAAWRRHDPYGPAPIGIHLAGDGKFALVVLPRGHGLVWTMGADTTARDLDGAVVADRGHGLTVTLSDPGVPVLEIGLTPGARALWADELEAVHP